MSNTWIDSYGGIVYDDSVGSGEPFPSPDSVAYRGQWGAYTDVENWGLHLRGDYYSARWGRWLTRQSAGVNEYSAGTNPVDSWIDPLQDLLSLVGIFDPSRLVDLVNAGVYALRGRWAEAGSSVVAIVPVVGDVAKVGTAAKLERSVARLAGQVGRSGSLLSTWYHQIREVVLRKLTVPVYRMVSKAEAEAIVEAGYRFVPSYSSRLPQTTRVFLGSEMSKMLKFARDEGSIYHYEYLMQSQVWRWGFRRSILVPDVRGWATFVVHVPTINRYMVTPARLLPLP